MKFKIGEKVTYCNTHKKEHGIIKNISDEENYFVVYNCAKEWKNYKNYTAARTHESMLVKGWI